MIQTLAGRLAGFVIRNDDTADREVLEYGLGLLISAIISYVVIFSSALLFGLFVEMLVTVALYSTMRFIIGGSHANSKMVCEIMYTSSLYLLIIVSSVISLNVYVVTVLYVVNLALILKYAPGDTVQQPIAKGIFTRKLFGILFLSLFFTLSIFVHETRVFANLLLLVPTLTSVFLHPIIYNIMGCKRSKIREVSS